MRALEWLFWLGVCGMSALASLRMWALWFRSDVSAPQYAAEAAGIVAMVVVPYVFARAVQAMRRLGTDNPEARAPWRDTEPGGR